MNLDDSYDPYKAAYSSMLSHASSNQEVKQLYINDHSCYVYRFGMITNGLGIVRDISFLNKDFLLSHPDITVDKNLILLMKINRYMALRNLFLY